MNAHPYTQLQKKSVSHEKSTSNCTSITIVLSFHFYFYFQLFILKDDSNDYTLPPGIDSPLDGSTSSLNGQASSSVNNSVASPRRPAPSIPAGLGGAKRVAPLPPR